MNKVFGIVYNNRFVSNRMNVILDKSVDDGVYFLNMDEDDFLSSIEVADIEEARKYFKKASKVEILQGVSYKNGIIPKNPIKYKIPMIISNPLFDDLEEVEILKIKDEYYYFQTLITQNAYMLMDVKSVLEEMEEKKEIVKDAIQNIKGVNPESRIVYSLLFFDLAQEIEKNKVKEPEEYFDYVFDKCNATVSSVKIKATGYEVVWNCLGYSINSFFSKDYKVLEAGFCVSGEDTKHSVSSLANLLQDYEREGSYIYKTRR